MAGQDIGWNRHIWNKPESFQQGGDEWSTGWGSSANQWSRTIYPRIMNYIPAGNILEIAPGHGRWTRFILRNCNNYIGVDLSQECVKTCRQRFAFEGHAAFFENDGKSLPMVADRSVDFLFSMDSLVHADIDAIEPYVKEFSRVLSDRGVGFIHHSNFAALGAGVRNLHARAVGVSAERFRDLCAENGLWCCAQEIINWGQDDLNDCFSVFRRVDPCYRGENSHAPATSIVTNNRFLDEISSSRAIFDLYK